MKRIAKLSFDLYKKQKKFEIWCTTISSKNELLKFKLFDFKNFKKS